LYFFTNRLSKKTVSVEPEAKLQAPDPPSKNFLLRFHSPAHVGYGEWAHSQRNLNKWKNQQWKNVAQNKSWNFAMHSACESPEIGTNGFMSLRNVKRNKWSVRTLTLLCTNNNFLCIANNDTAT